MIATLPLSIARVGAPVQMWFDVVVRPVIGIILVNDVIGLHLMKGPRR
jgi:hypothetical protein